MVNTFSFCLYGPQNPKYYDGMLSNIELAEKHFPDWKVYVWIGSDVPPDFTEKMSSYPNVVIRETGKLGEINMIYRFFTIDEADVDIMFVRDADSRIHWKDRWAIRHFLSSPFFIHTIRDNREHTAHMMGGIWGIRKSVGIHMKTEYENYKEDTSKGHRHAHDQNFLSDVLYPKYKHLLLVHYSNACIHIEEYGCEFPFEYTNDVYCGRIEEPSTFIDHPQAEQKINPTIRYHQYKPRPIVNFLHTL